MSVPAGDKGVVIRMNIVRRPRRLRGSQAIRDMIHEYDVNLSDLIYPVFVVEGEDVKEKIPSMPGIFHHSLDTFKVHLKEIWDSGVRSILFLACRIIKMRWAARLIIKMESYSGRFG